MPVEDKCTSVVYCADCIMIFFITRSSLLVQHSIGQSAKSLLYFNVLKCPIPHCTIVYNSTWIQENMDTLRIGAIRYKNIDWLRLGEMPGAAGVDGRPIYGGVEEFIQERSKEIGQQTLCVFSEEKIYFFYFFLLGWGVVFGTKKNFFLKMVYMCSKFPLNPFSIPEYGILLSPFSTIKKDDE